MHILLVDDDEDHRHTLAAALRQRGHRVRAVGDGLRALLYLDDHVDLLVTDVAMPGLDGVGLVRTLRERFPDLPVIVMSGEAGSASTASALRQHAAAFLAKPVDLAEFLERVRRIGSGEEGPGQHGAGGVGHPRQR